jgi:hypothetical protein
MVDRYSFMGHQFEDDPIKDLKEDFKFEGQRVGAVEVLVVQDIDTGEYYPVNILPDDNRDLKYSEYNNSASGQKVVDTIKL